MTRRTVIALVGMVLFGLLVVLTVWSVAFWFTALSQLADCTCGGQIPVWQQHIGISAIGLLVTLGLVALSAWILSALVWSWYKTGSMLKLLVHLPTPTAVLNSWQHLSYRFGQLVIFSDKAPQAFCAGLIRPQVYCSSGLVEHITPTQLSAIFSHELAHARSFDPFVQLVCTALTSFFPARLRAQMRGALLQYMECETDQLAAHAVGRGVLGQALLQVANWEPALPGVVAAGMASLVEQRLEVLAGWRSRPAFPWKSIYAMLTTLVCIMASALLFFNRTQTVFATSAVLACQAETTVIINQEPYVFCYE